MSCGRTMQGLWWIGDDNNLLSYREDVVEPNIKDPDDVKIKVAYSGLLVIKLWHNKLRLDCFSKN